MGIPIDTIPVEELFDDLAATDEDILMCRMALAMGIAEFKGSDLEERLTRNTVYKMVIESELHRRSLLN